MSYGNNQTVVRDLHVTVKIGGVTLNKPVEFETHWGNNIQEDPLIGTDIPDMWTSKYQGSIILDFPYSTDLNLDSLSKPGSDGEVPSTTITIALLDTQDTPKTDTWTFTAKLWQPRLTASKQDPTVRARLTGILTTRPQRTQA